MSKVTTTILWKIILKGNPKTIPYKESNLFDQNKLNEELGSKLKVFQDILLSVPNNSAPILKKLCCYKHNTLVSK